MKKMKIFNEYHGLLDSSGETLIYGFENISQERSEPIEIDKSGSSFGYVNKGFILIKHNNIVTKINEGFYFSLPKEYEITLISDSYQFCVWVQKGYDSPMRLGLLENEGRLKYIDGCKDSVLLNPTKMGDPCLNALFMPEGVNQTSHTHPSLRSGFIIDGGAICEAENGTFNLESGQIFYLEQDAKHKFRSDLSDFVRMRLIAFHPDSDFGATDETHPMLNRTIVNGVSASDIDEIRTK